MVGNRLCQGEEHHGGFCWCYSDDGAVYLSDKQTFRRIAPNQENYVDPRQIYHLHYLNICETRELSEEESRKLDFICGYTKLIE